MSQLSLLIKKIRKKFGIMQPKFETRKESAFPVTDGPIDTKIHSRTAPIDCSHLQFPGVAKQDKPSQLQSCLCTHEQLDSAAFRYWASKIHERWRLHRKLWEFCYILQALYERGMLADGKKGLGFAVGEEPLPSLMASMGCTVLATDLDVNDPRATVWADTNQLTAGLAMLNQRRICPEDLFKQRVNYRPVDMNHIPTELRNFDFTWSSCSFEHCGSIELGKKFIVEQMKCLKPGGVAIHTTEFNLSSNDETIEEGPTVIFRRKDVEEMIRSLQAEGHEVQPFQMDVGSSKEDLHIDTFPYGHELHLKLHLFDRYVSTSVGLIIRKNPSAAIERAA